MSSFKKRLLSFTAITSAFAFSVFATHSIVDSVNPEYASKVESKVVSSIVINDASAISFSWGLVEFDSNDDVKVWLGFNNWVKNFWSGLMFVLPYIWAFAWIVLASWLILWLLYIWAKKMVSKYRWRRK